MSANSATAVLTSQQTAHAVSAATAMTWLGSLYAMIPQTIVEWAGLVGIMSTVILTGIQIARFRMDRANFKAKKPPQ